ncbi:MAG: hypothetical protein K2H71_05325, partial [Muribaculaceae bacterium]|nr:hypothetical protein [Muribaculaceae bacterium]
GDDGLTMLTVPAIAGKHNYRAFYSGNTDVANAVSNEITIESAAVDSLLVDSYDIMVAPRKGGIEVLRASVHSLDIYSSSGEKVKTVKTNSLPLFVSLDAGLYIIANQKFVID